jgi:hypothetical protein
LDWPEIFSSAIVAVLAVWLGATVVSRAPGDRAARLFSLMAVVLAAWAGSRALQPLSDPGAALFLRHVHDAAAYLLPPTFAHLVVALTSPRIPTRRAVVIVLAYISALPLALRAFTDPDRPFHVDPPHFSLPGIEGEVFGWAWIAVRLAVLGAAAWWAWSYASAVRTDASRNRQAMGILTSVLLGTAGGALLILPTLSRPPVWFSVSVLGIALVCAAYAVFAQRVFLAPEVARRAVSSTLVGGLAVVALVSILAGVEALADRALGVGLPIVTALALALALAVYDPARVAWRRFTLGRELAHREGVIPRGLGSDRLGAQHADDSIGPALSRLVWRLDLIGASVFAADGSLFAEAGITPDEGDVFEVALAVDGTLHGRLVVGPKRSGVPFTEADRLVFDQTADYVAAALDLGSRQRQHADERAALVNEREAQDAKARALAAAVDAELPPVLRVYALGPLRAQVGEAQVTRWGGKKAGSRQAEGMFAFLFDRGERGVSKDEFLDLIWPDVPFERSDPAFHRTMNGLRGTLESSGATVVFSNDRYRLHADAVAWSDVTAFEGTLVEAGAGVGPDALRALKDGRALYRGDYLDDCPFYGDSAEVEVRRSALRERFVDLLVALGTHYEGAGDRPAAADAFRHALATSSEDCPPALDGLTRLRAHA